MSKDKTHVEIRNEKIDRELFQITEEMREAMEQARIENIRRTEAVVEPVIDSESNNFRAYDQNQDFFVTVSKYRTQDNGNLEAQENRHIT